MGDEASRTAQNIRYNRVAVEREIRKDKRIKGKGARLIHALLKGRQQEDEK
jgi:hypothetical protein